MVRQSKEKGEAKEANRQKGMAQMGHSDCVHSDKKHVGCSWGI